MGEETQEMTKVNSLDNGKDEFTRKKRRTHAIFFAIIAPIALVMLVSLVIRPDSFFSINVLLFNLYAGAVLSGMLFVLIGALEVLDRYAPKIINKLKKYRQQLLEIQSLLQDIKNLRGTINGLQKDVESIHDTKACLEIRSLLEKHLTESDKKDGAEKKIDPRFFASVIYQYGNDIRNLQKTVDEIKHTHGDNNEIFADKIQANNKIEDDKS